MPTFLYRTDRQYSVLGKSPREPFAYSTYGALSLAHATRLAFCGQSRDALTAKYPLGNGRRFYSPKLMRFTSPDSFSPFGKGGINVYAYCGGDPVNRHDPGGAFWSTLLRAIGVASSGATLFGSLVRTARNVVGRRGAFNAANANTGRESPINHTELPHASRVANQQFFITGSAGVAGQLTAAFTGATPTFQSATDVLSAVNAVTNLSGGSIGNFAAAREVVGYLRANPREIPVVAYETLMDVTMVDEVLSTVGRGFLSAAAKIRSWGSRPYDVHS
ncbi:RHS repeat-associated core domain-containing protein [Pseudomonas sp. NBRC 111119]|uniref:RHS repeat-associated core domain-containing protein n=1 Tax=Pseudomonas sp. NBRC 111119 TaxID=1661034 RepID=UPI0009EA96C3|nr:RHS repeat-associated core domain-containing protein [Pseudomonas sp. NBRC 111119]